MAFILSPKKSFCVCLEEFGNLFHQKKKTIFCTFTKKLNPIFDVYKEILFVFHSIIFDAQLDFHLLRDFYIIHDHILIFRFFSSSERL